MMTKPFMKPKGPLTQAEYEKFQAKRRRVISGVIVAFSFVGVLAISIKFLHLEPHPAVPFLFFPITIWLLIQMFKFKCPRCGTTPMTTRTSFGGGEVVVGSFVALRPKKCHKCGVAFAPPQPDANQITTSSLETKE
jgi:hypothetical protein